MEACSPDDYTLLSVDDQASDPGGHSRIGGDLHVTTLPGGAPGRHRVLTELEVSGSLGGHSIPSRQRGERWWTQGHQFDAHGLKLAMNAHSVTVSRMAIR
jgi:hypothetical protein